MYISHNYIYTTGSVWNSEKNKSRARSISVRSRVVWYYGGLHSKTARGRAWLPFCYPRVDVGTLQLQCHTQEVHFGMRGLWTKAACVFFLHFGGPGVPLGHPWVPFVHRWGTLGAIWTPFWHPWVPFGHHLGALGLHLGTLGPIFVPFQDFGAGPWTPLDTFGQIA